MAGGKSSGGMTPMMKQYHALRGDLPDDVLLLFRLGDFYEMFFEDAKVASPILNVALTKRNGMPMCGIPHHAAEGYIGKLVKAGKRVALAEQTSEPRPGQIVEREISQVISAGTIADLNLLDASQHNFLAAVFVAGGAGKRGAPVYGLAYVDLTTGDFRVTERSSRGALDDELARVAPSETLYSDEQAEEFADALGGGAMAYDGYTFLEDQALHNLVEHFKVQSLDGFGCAGMGAALCAAGAALHYIKFQLRRSADHLQRLQPDPPERYVLIDAASQRNLDLVPGRGQGPEHTLLGALDRTCTPMGARLLRDWLLHPLRDLAELVARQELVGALVSEHFVLSQLREDLGQVRDIERTVTRLSQGGGNARDLQTLARGLGMVPAVREHVAAVGQGGLAAALGPRLRGFGELVAKLDAAICDEPPVSIREGGIFRDGFSGSLDGLRAGAREGKRWIADLQVREAEATGIKSLKVRFNAVFGYFIEVTKSNLDGVPEHYVRKQTMANAERFITPELKEMEDKVLGADERAKQLEYEEFLALREAVLEHLGEIQDTAAALATLDVIAGLAETARLFGYCRPELNSGKNLVVQNGRHPVLDQNLGGEKFVPNDVLLEPRANRLLLITGPNMAGKSTYIRQVALITIMAQTGSWVPAERAEVGLVDRVFTRVGASDDLARGQSTFMVEMNETALIVNNATDRSLVVLDEIGRGTSTFDGLSIAWSVAEFLHDTTKARTLFATHYHEMTALARMRDAVQNYNVAVREWNDRVIFLRKIVAGTADKSYGIQVARLAGLPPAIIQRAKDILENLEKNASSPQHGGGGGEIGAGTGTSAAAAAGGKKKSRRNGGGGAGAGQGAEMPASPPPQLTLFD